jgi:ATP-dependent DNA helicase RecG
VVALYALLMAVADRRQGALMAPTELLAEQHSMSIGRMLGGSNVRLALLTGTQPPPGTPERDALLRRIASGEVDLVIGTHALLTEHVRFADLAVVVVDEQHRFGVQQRAMLRERPSEPRLHPAGDSGLAAAAQKAPSPTPSPHYLVMTATPIPRTLSLTVFGDLDVSVINSLPPGRTPITTRVVEPAQTDEVYGYLGQRLARREQAYVVLPAIEESGEDSAAQLKGVRQHARQLQHRLGEEYRVAAIHGRLKRQTREMIMDRFRRGLIHVLVATTVIEVGVDVPNATVMVVEHAERFGLAQLHQLRGRVGRNADGRRSVCVLIAEPGTEDARQRLEALRSTTDGFRIAEHDLAIRGMGEFFGTRQSGMPPLRVASIPDDMELLQMARRDAAALIEADPELTAEEHSLLRKVLWRQYGQALGLIDVG